MEEWFTLLHFLSRVVSGGMRTVKAAQEVRAADGGQKSMQTQKCPESTKCSVHSTQGGAGPVDIGWDTVPGGFHTGCRDFS